MNGPETRDSGGTQDPSYTLREMAAMAAANRRWFAAAMALCLGLALLRVYTAPKVYTRSAAILIKDSRRGNVTSAAFSEIPAAQIIPNVENEIFLLGSQRLMEEVVRELKLDVGYFAPKGLSRRELFGISPIEVAFPDGDAGQGQSFRATLREGGVTLSGFRAAGLDDMERRLETECALGDTVATPIGRLAVIPTAAYGNLGGLSAVDVRRVPPAAAANAFRKRLDVSLNGEAGSVVVLSLRDVSPHRAELLLNTLMKAYLRDVVGEKRRVAELGRRFIDDRLALIEAELAAEDGRILGFREQHGVVDFAGQVSLSMNEGSRLRSGIFELENQSALVAYLKEYLESDTSAGLLPVNVGITDGNLGALIAEYNSEVIRRDELLKNSNERNPAIVSINSAIRAKRETIAASVDNLLEQLEINLRQARMRERMAEGRMSEMPSRESEMSSITRRQAVKEQLYLYLLNKKEENALGSVLADSDARIVEYACGPDVPLSPKPVRIIVFALLAALAVPFTALLILNLVNSYVRGRRDIEGRCSLPFIGQIPRFRTMRSGITLGGISAAPVTEAFRRLCDAIECAPEGGGRRVTLVTSCEEGSGKTLCAAGLAAVLAERGRRVVVVDGDMRKATFSRIFGARDHSSGLSFYLADRSVVVDDVVAGNAAGSGVDVVFAGARPADPAGLLAGERFGELIAELKLRYDDVIIDSPHVLGDADAVIEAKAADRTVFVMREGATPLHRPSDAEKLQSDGKLPSVAVVLNCVRSSVRRFISAAER